MDKCNASIIFDQPESRCANHNLQAGERERRWCLWVSAEHQPFAVLGRTSSGSSLPSKPTVQVNVLFKVEDRGGSVKEETGQSRKKGEQSSKRREDGKEEAISIVGAPDMQVISGLGCCSMQNFCHRQDTSRNLFTTFSTVSLFSWFPGIKWKACQSHLYCPRRNPFPGFLVQGRGCAWVGWSPFW